MGVLQIAAGELLYVTLLCKTQANASESAAKQQASVFAVNNPILGPNFKGPNFKGPNFNLIDFPILFRREKR